MPKKKNMKTEPRLRAPAIGWITKAEIETLLTSGVRTEAMTHLRMQDIEVAEDGVFQWRDRRCDPRDKARHIAVLVRALSITGAPFDPLLVFPAGGRYFVIDGHHRLAAYEAANWNDPIPVEMFEGSLQAARIAALEGNRKDKLPMSRIEKSNAAWRLVAEDEYSKQRTADLGQVSIATITNMRKQRRKITEAGEDPLSMDWERARQWPGKTSNDYDPDWRERKAQDLAQRLTESGLATEVGKYPDLFVDALALIDPEWPAMLADHVETDALEEILEARQEDKQFDQNKVPVDRMHDF
jgi:ParB-like chromosome segregation protein Spo0J